MGSNSPLPGLTGKIVLTLSHSVAISLSLARFSLRMGKHRLWWDDWTVTSAAVVDAFYMLTIWVKQLHHATARRKLDGVIYQSAWLLFFPGYFVTWASRVSLWLSLARVYPSRHLTRRLAFILATIFGFLGILCTLVTLVGCGGSKWETRLRHDNCFRQAHSLGDLPLYAKLLFGTSLLDILCDITLVAVPVYLLSNVRLERKRKLAIILLASGSILPTIFEIILIVAPFASRLAGEALATLINSLVHVSTTVVLISANFLVVGAALYSCIERRVSERFRTTGRNSGRQQTNGSGTAVTYIGDLTRISSATSIPRASAGP